jgi:arabinoxylan arabinofuranohydrolase
MMSDSPTNFPKEKYVGLLFPNQSQFFGAGTGGNNHQSVFEFEGKYYFTYHAPTLNKRINGNTTQGYRSPHIQELAFNADGTIQQVVGDYAGVDQVHDFDPYRTFEAETFGWSKGIATQKVDGGSAQFGATAPNLVVKDIDNGDWTALSSVAFGDAGPASISVKVKALQAGGSIDLRTGSETGPVVGSIPVNAPVGQWAELTADLEGIEGTHDLFFTYKGGSGDLFELDTWSFAEAAAPSVEVSAEATSRCVSGKAVLTVKVTNADEVPVIASVTTTYGAKSSIAVAAGKSASAAFTTRLADLPAGSAQVAVTATVGGQPVSATVPAPYTARSCG